LPTLIHCKDSEIAPRISLRLISHNFHGWGAEVAEEGESKIIFVNSASLMKMN